MTIRILWVRKHGPLHHFKATIQHLTCRGAFTPKPSPQAVKHYWICQLASSPPHLGLLKDTPPKDIPRLIELHAEELTRQLLLLEQHLA